MKKVVWLLGVVAFAVVLAPGPVVGAGEAAKLCEFDRLAKALKISGKQRRAMETVLAGLDRKLKSWDADNAGRGRAIEAELAQARKKRDVARMCSALVRRNALQGERLKLVTACKAALLALLTKPQRADWETHLLLTEMHVRFKGLRLSKEQLTDIRSRCAKAGRLIADLRTRGKPAKTPREAAKATHALERKIVQETLTDAQRKILARAANGPRPPKAGETEAQRRERIRLAAAGWTSKRLASDQAKGAKDTEAGMNSRLARAPQRRGAGGTDNANQGTDWQLEMLRLMNEARRENGLKAMSLDGNLNAAAQGFAVYMSDSGKFSHSADGRSPSQRARAAGYAGGAAENIAMGPAHARPVFDMWMKSPGHRANILGKNHNTLGLGWQGKYWVANFGTK